VVRARDADGVVAWIVMARDGDSVTLRGMDEVKSWTWTEPVAEWADWTEWDEITAIPVDPQPLVWREVDGVLGLHPVEPREPMGHPPSWGAKPFPCVLPDFADPLDSARLAAEAAEAEVRALTEALEAARRRSLEAYAAYASAVQRGLGEALRALRS
jgi:hypothetical protein